METTNAPIVVLFERTEEYIKSALQLNKLKFIDAFAEKCSRAISQIIMAVIVIVLFLSATIALALWLGDIYGKNYIGFLLVSLIYGTMALLYLGIQAIVQRKINVAIVKHFFKS